MEIVRVGSEGLTSSCIALGCMGMSEFYIGATKAKSEATIHAAVAHGITMFDTADMYGPFANEEFVGACLKELRGQVQIATKFGYVRKADGTRLGLNGRPEYVRSACEASLRRLGLECIDLYYLHRVDRTVPIEDTVGAMAQLVSEGKVRFIGLSEVSASTLRRAHTVAPISAVQSEYSLISRDPEFDLFATLQQLNIGFVAYAPLGRGLLTGRYKSADDLPPEDYRRATPRFSSANLPHNADLAAVMGKMARENGLTPAQLALAWVRHKADGAVALVGTTDVGRLSENLQSIGITLAPDLVARLDEVFPRHVARGTRYPDMSRVNG